MPTLAQDLLSASAAGNLAQVRTLLSANTTTTLSQIAQTDLDNVLFNIAAAVVQYPATATNTEVFNTISLYMTKAGAGNSAAAIVTSIGNLAQHSADTYTDYLNSVRDMCNKMTTAQVNSLAPDNYAASDALIGIVQNVMNPASVTTSEMNSTLSAFVSKLGAKTSTDDLLWAVETLAEHSANTATDYLDSVRTILNGITSLQISVMAPDNYAASTALIGIVQNVINPVSVTTSEMNSTLSAFVSKLGAKTSTDDLLWAVETLAEHSANTATDYLDSVRTILNGITSLQISVMAPDNYAASNALIGIVQNVMNPASVTTSEMNSTLSAFVSKLGAKTSTDDLLWAVETLAEHSANTATDYLDSVRTILNGITSAQISVMAPDNYAAGNALFSIVLNVGNPVSVTKTELNSTVDLFMAKLGEKTNAYDLGTAINIFSGAGNQDTANVIVTRLSTSRFDEVSATMDITYGGAAKLLTSGDNYFDNRTVNKTGIFGGAGNDYILGGQANEAIYGGAGNDYIIADQWYSVSDDKVYGGDGNDELISYSGNDYIEAGLGNDTIYSGKGNDTIIGGSGMDTVSYNGSHITAGVAVNLTLTGAQNTGITTASGGIDTISQVENVTGTQYADILTGNNVANRLQGANGNDTLFGGLGNDILEGDGGGNLSFLGNDVLSGGTGSDTLTGNLGSDTFVFLRGETGKDTITDFKVAEGDKIDISDILEQSRSFDWSMAYGGSPLYFIEATRIGTTNNWDLKVDVDAGGGFYTQTTVAQVNNLANFDVQAMINSGNLIV